MTVFFTMLGGGAYTMGNQNHGNYWHLFTIDNYTDGLKIPDQTLEVSLHICANKVFMFQLVFLSSEISCINLPTTSTI